MTRLQGAMNGERRLIVAVVAGLLFASIFVLRLSVADPDAAILLLCAVPTAMLAAELGLLAGLAAAALSFCLVAIWAEDESLGAVGYATRGITLLLVGGLIGWLTDRRRAAERHNARQFELSLDLLGVAGFDGYFKRVNPAFERALGYSADELCARPFLDFVHPDDRERTEAEAAKLAETGVDTIEFQNRYRAKDGSYRWIEWSTRAVAEEQLLYAAAQDITERKLRERYVHVEHDAVRLLAHARSLPDVAPALLRVIGEGMEWPVAALWMASGDEPGAKLERIASWTADGAVAPELPAAGEELDAARERAEPRWVPADIADDLHARFVLPVPGSDGVTAVMEFLSRDARSPEPDMMRLLDSLAGQVGQFHERTLAQAALAARERETRQILTSAHDAFVGMDAEGRISDWNPQAEAVFGWPRDEALGRDLADTLIPERHREAHRRGLEHFLATGDGPVLGRVLELSALHRDGRELPVELTISAIDTERGHTFNAFLRDISERKRVAEELAVARDQALEASRLKSDFLATMSHEIRTPMNGVIGMTALLLDTELDPVQREYAETVSASGEALLTIINDILDFSKIEAGRLELESIDFDLRTVVEEVVTLLADTAHEKGLELAALIPPTMPTAVRGDPGRLRQVLMNLVANAIKFTETGEVVVRAEAVDEDDDQMLVRIAVADTGIGVDPETHTALFEPFRQADTSTTRTHGGTGLGLAISKQLVELMGGEIGVESEPGRGSTFTFTARVRKQSDQANDLPYRRGHLAGLRVLIVDDNATNRMLLERQVASWAMGSASAESGPAALELLHASESGRDAYDIVLLDMDMPGMDGLDLARAIRGDPALARLPLVLLTSSAVRGSTEAARRAGISAYLTKPVRQSQLYDALATVLGSGIVAAPLVTPQTISEAKARSRPRLLVVEDNEVNQRVAVAMLAKLGYGADVAANGIEAVDALDRFAYGAVLMDCQMPLMDGYAATAEIRRREAGSRRVPIIAMTAAAVKGEREKCIAAGMDDYVSKPVTLEDLRAALERRIGGGEENGAGEAAGPFDPDTVAVLRGLTPDGEPDGFVTLTRLFLTSGSELLDALRAAIEHGDADAVATTAHTLKGGAANLGALRLADACRRLEDELAGGLEGTGPALARIEAEFEEVRAWLAADAAAD